MSTSIFTKTRVAKVVQVAIMASAIYSSCSLADDLNETQNYNIASGQLSVALNQFAAQTGVFLSADFALLSNKNTAGVSGSATGLMALSQLLAGTGLTFKLDDKGTVMILSEEEIIKDENGVNLPVLLVEDSESTAVVIGKRVLDASEIDSMAGGDGNLTDLLQGNGAVRYSLTSSSSANSASMRPDEISIHGQSHYQNAYIIDGISANNDLNPGDSEDTYTNPITPTNLSMLGGSSSQAYYVDPDALESVEVYDSNVPVEFGGFLGGVVSSTLKRYDGEDSLSIKYAISKDEWTEMHVDESLEEDFSDGDLIDGSYTPDFLKQRLTISGAKGITEDTGVTFTASRATSNFSQSYVKNIGSTIYGQQGIEYDDTVDNFMGRVDHKANDKLDLGMSILYANRYHDGLTSASYESGFVKSHQSNGIGIDAEYLAENGTLKGKISYSESSDNLDSDDSFYTYHQADYYAGGWPYEGGYGDINQQQNTTELSLDWIQNTFSFANADHIIKTGLKLDYETMFYEVEDDISYSFYRCETTGCTDRDDEYLYSTSEVEKNKLDVSGYSAGVYLSDNFTVGDFDYYLGVRADYNSILENLDLSPRANVTWDLFGDSSTKLITGASRYYGRSFFRYEVNSTLRSWRTFTRYNSDGSVYSTTEYSDDSLSDYDLKTPYSDELMIGAIQRFGVIDASLTFVNRESKDMVTRAETDDGLDYYDNLGESSSFNISLELKTREPIEIGNTKTYGTFAVSYQESDSNVTSDVSYEDEISSSQVYYNGEVVYLTQLPSVDYNIPFAVDFSTTTQIPDWNIVWSNRVNVKFGGKVAQNTYEDYTDSAGVDYDIYADLDFDGLITLDTSIEWKPQLFKEVSGSIEVSVNNVFDDVVDMSTSSGTYSYTAGRSISLAFGAYF